MRRTRMIPAVAAVALFLGVAACTATPPGHPGTGAASLAGSAPPTARLSSKEPGPKTVVGVNLYAKENYSLADTRAWGARDLRYIARTLKLKAVSIAFDYNVTGRYSDTVTASPTRTPTMADLAALTSIARSYGLRVEYRVLFAVGNSDSRGQSIQPRSLRAWLGSLLTAETPALKLAQANHVSEFIVGTEMASVDQSPLWGGFFAGASRLFHGILSYSQWGGKSTGSGLGGFFSPKRVLLPERYFGVSAYPPVNLPATASVARLTDAWLAFLRQAPESVLYRTAIDEMGIPAAAGAYRAPYQWDGLGDPKPDLAVQANWYRAACQAAVLVHVRALYFWSAALSSDPASAHPSLVGFEGHPATVAAIRSCP